MNTCRKIMFTISVVLFVYTFTLAQMSHLPITDFELYETTWQLIKADTGPVANIKLRSGGKIEGYTSYNEAKWGIEDRELVFYNQAGEPAIRFDSFEKKNNKWVISGGGGAYILKETSGAPGIIKQPAKPTPEFKSPQPPSYPYTSGLYARTTKNVYTENEPIVVEYFNLPGYQQDWITIVAATASDNTYGEWFYTGGKRSGTYTFKGLPAGNYEVRVYFNWPQGQYTVMSRYPFTVTKGYSSNYNGGITWDFETGDLRGWTATGDAFNHQPTFGDNPTARHRGQPSNHQGNYWIGGYEKRPTPSHTPGDIQGDGPQGTLTSQPFVIFSPTISFLIGGGCDINNERVELLIDGIPVLKETGKCNETMKRVYWNVTPYLGRSAQIRLVDSSSGGWGHINFDDVRFE